MMELRRRLKRFVKVFAVKPLLVIYMLQYSIVGPISSQLWLDRTCLVNLKINSTICNNLHQYSDIENQVQKEVTRLNIVGNYIETIPEIIVSLLLGPYSDHGRKFMMFLPFVGHIFSGGFSLLFLYFDTWPVQLLWIQNVYILFGGYSVLSIAMYGYIGDVTTDSERTTMISILSGVGMAFFPLADFLSGQIFQAGGYNAVYGISFGFTIIGMIYVYFIPESITKREVEFSDEKHTNSFRQWVSSITDCYKTLTKQRKNGSQNLIYGILFILVFGHLGGGSGGGGLLYVEKKFGWSVVDYTNYRSISVLMLLAKTFITTPLYSYFFKMHDCMASMTGDIVTIAYFIVVALATQGWMMYYASALGILGALNSTPLRSLISKLVEPTEYGKIFTIAMVVSSLASLATRSGFQELYAETVATFPGLTYLVSAGIQSLALVLTAILFYVIVRHEQRYGPIDKKLNAL